jgi:uncharacterized spore protein YtfJ
MVCYDIIHDRNCPSYNNNNTLALKGASTIIKAPRARTTRINTVGGGGGPNKQVIPIPETEIKLVNNALNIVRLYISKNQELFQNPEAILDKVNESLQIVSSKLGNNNNRSTKGASDNNNNNNNSYQSLVNIRNMLVGLSKSTSIKTNQLKGASANSDNNNICTRKQNLINLLEHFNLI